MNAESRCMHACECIFMGVHACVCIHEGVYVDTCVMVVQPRILSIYTHSIE